MTALSEALVAVITAAACKRQWELFALPYGIYWERKVRRPNHYRMAKRKGLGW